MLQMTLGAFFSSSDGIFFILVCCKDFQMPDLLPALSIRSEEGSALTFPTTSVTFLFFFIFEHVQKY